MKRFVITGAPGAGKTAIIRQLELEGFGVVEEAATDVIAPRSPFLSAELERIRNDTVYDPRVFFIRNLGFVTPTDARRISFEETVRFEKIHEETYRQFGFELVSIEPAGLADRVRTIKSML